MAHSPLICRDCFTETDIRSVYDRSDTAQTGLVCPNCGCESFSI